MKLQKNALRAMLAFALFFTLGIGVSAGEADCLYLARTIAAFMADEPFTVKTAYGEMLLARTADDRFPDTLPAVVYALHGANDASGTEPTEADLRAAAAAARQLGFAGGALYALPWSEVKNTPLAMQNGVKLYDWFFYR